jgi:hypothetical protein
MAPKKKSPISEGIKEITGGYKPVATPKDATGMQGVGITGTDRNVAKEIEAAKLGYSPEYIASRGGINTQGYFNDVALSGQLTAAEQQSVRLPNGTVNTQAMADILQKKQIAELVAKGMSQSEATAQVSAQYGKFGVPLTTGGTTGMGAGIGAGGTAGIGGALPGLKTDAQIKAETLSAEKKAERQSAYDLLYSEFDRYGLASLVTPLKDLITSGASPSEFTIRLRETDAYKNRFAANQARIKNGLRALSESEYIRNEDAYQEVMRRRGLPPEYYEQTVDPITGITKQKGFEALLSGDVSSAELEDRIVTAQDRVINANPEIAATLRQFYPGISNGDVLAYTLDPANAINAIKRKITAAEIGAAAGTYGLAATASRAEQLAATGVTEATAQQGFKTISQIAPRAEMLSQIYNQDAYTQETAEREFFGLTGAAEAEKQRKKLTSLETAAFSGSAGAGVIARDRAGVI